MSTAWTRGPAVTTLDLGPLKPVHRGKVRESSISAIAC
jgi:hypothetical protein